MVRLLGPLGVETAAGIALGPVPAGRASLLLQRLVSARGSFVGVDALVDALWHDETPATAERTVASLVSRVRSALGPDVVVGSSSVGYRFNEGQRWTSDLAEVEHLVEEAHRRSGSMPSLAVSAARQGLQLLSRGRPQMAVPFVDRPWVDDLGRHVDRLRRRVLRALWTSEAHLGLWSDIVEQTESALEQEPHDEHAARALMHALCRLGDRGSALRVYDQLRSHLLAELGLEPSSETDELYAAIARGDGSSVPEPAMADALSQAAALTGRERELAQLVRCWSSAAAGTVALVMVTGPPGSGRTRLCRELADIVRRTGGRALHAHCFEGERSMVLQPLLTMLSQVVVSTPPEMLPALLGTWSGTAAELVPELRQAMSIGDYQRASADLEHRRILQTLAHVLGGAASRHPTLLLLDDLHNAGTSTIEALGWLVHELSDAPLMIAATAQADRIDADLATLAGQSVTVELGALSERDVEALATAGGLRHDATFIWELTGGHLLFVVEVIAALRRGLPREAIPSTLRSMVLHRVQRHGRAIEELLQVASAIGSAFDVATLAVLTGRSAAELIPALQTSLSAGLLEPRGDMFAFTSPIIRTALYESTVGPLRNLRHRQLAAVFEDRPELRAGHLSAAGDVGEAAAAWYDAAMLARRSFANRDAARLFTAALEAARAAGDVALVGMALIGRGTSHEELAEYELAVDDHAAAEALGLTTGDRRLRAEAVERLGWTAYYRRDVDEAVRRAEEATAMTGARPSAWALLGRIKHWAGDFDASATAYSTALEGVGGDDAVRASVLSCLGALLEHRDQYDAATGVLDEAIEVCHQIGAFRPLLRALFFQGLAHANAGDFTGALTALETKRALLDRYGVSFYRARTNTCLAWVWRELGDPAQARALSEQALDQSREVDEGELQIEQELHALCSLADCDRLEGRLDAAGSRLETAWHLVDTWLPFKWRAELRIIEIASRLGAEDPERLLADARQRGSSKYEALALHLLGRPTEAVKVAEPTSSLLLLAEVAPGAVGSEAASRLERRLPRRMRASFATHGRLALEREG
jgi:DNA-binding SARP family transcriptional activator/tetratricopeptide (TPR) repeat protein